MQAPKGLFDILPSIQDPKGLWRQTHLWQHVEGTIRETCQTYGFQEIRTPIFEKTELFARGVGDTSDIVQKEMYTFSDRGERSMTLRPEGTAAVMRAFLENHLDQQGSIHKLFYMGPMFRYERPQAGRYRQHHQFGVEAVGAKSPLQDVEVIDLLLEVLRRLGLPQTTVLLNSLGDLSARKAYRQALQAYLKPHFHELSADSQQRFEANPLRILDSKDPKDKEITQGSPSLLNHLNEEAQEHFQEVQRLLTHLSIPYELDSSLVRGLDYYNRTVFEVVSGKPGAQSSVAGGGRYDGLLKSLGGPDLPAFGFGCGLERLIQTLLYKQTPLPLPPRPDLMLLPLGEPAQQAAMALVQELRKEGKAVCVDVTGKKLKHAMRYAHQAQVRYTAVIGENELAANQIPIKEMESGETHEIPLSKEAVSAFLQTPSPAS